MLSLFIGILLLIIIYIGISWFLSSQILSPKSSLALSKEKMKTDWGTSYEAMMSLLPKPVDFTIDSFDGVPLKGKYFASEVTPKCVIIAPHGWTGTWAEMLKYVPALADCVYDLVLYDHRAHGDSGKVYPTGGINEAKDLLAVTEWVQKTKGFENSKIGWLGSSWGASTVLKAGESGKQVGFMILDSPFQDWYSAIFERAIRDYGVGVNLMSFGVMQIVNWRTGIDYRKASPLLAANERERYVNPLLTDKFKAIRIAAARSLIATNISTNNQAAYKKAYSELGASLEINLWRGEGVANKALLALQENDYIDAEKLLKKAMQIEPYFEASYINLADLYRSQQRPALVVSVLNKGMSVLPKSSALKYSLGLHLVRQKQLAGAMPYFEQTVTLSPNNAQYAYTFILALDGSGKSQLALTKLKKLAPRYQDKTQLKELGLYLSQKLQSRLDYDWFMKL